MPMMIRAVAISVHDVVMFMTSCLLPDLKNDCLARRSIPHHRTIARRYRWIFPAPLPRFDVPAFWGYGTSGWNGRTLPGAMLSAPAQRRAMSIPLRN